MRTCGTTKEMGRGLATFGPNLDTGIKGLVEFSPFVELDGTGEPTSACVDVLAGVSCSEEEVQRMKIIIGILNGYFYTCNLTCIGESTLS